MKYNFFSVAMFCLILLQLNIAFAQTHTKNEESFEVFYKRADSINLAQPNLIIDSNISNKLKKLDEKEPYHFFSEATSTYEFKNDKYDYATVIFYVGLIRYKYFMNVNPEYAPGDGWMICESMKQTYEKRIELYLQTNIDKYIAALKFATSYCAQNNYNYWKKPLNQTLLQKAIEPYETLLKDLETNREKYLKQWQEDRAKNLSSGK
jgi:hypothetical protein